MTRCLILVDLQNDYFPGGKMALDGIENAAWNAQILLNHFRESQLPIVHVQHLSMHPGATFFLPDTDGVNINALVAPLKGETVVQKNFPNSFRNTSLQDILKRGIITELAICGAMSHMCIDATARAAFDLGFSCIVVEDACATRDLIFHGRTIAASDVHASFMAALSAPYANVISTKALLANSA